jgi:hypothetical protein
MTSVRVGKEGQDKREKLGRKVRTIRRRLSLLLSSGSAAESAACPASFASLGTVARISRKRLVAFAQSPEEVAARPWASLSLVSLGDEEGAFGGEIRDDRVEKTEAAEARSPVERWRRCW